MSGTEGAGRLACARIPAQYVEVTRGSLRHGDTLFGYFPASLGFLLRDPCSISLISTSVTRKQ